MLSHNYHEALTRQIGICWERTADDVVWTPLPLFHFNAIVTAVLGPLVFGGRSAIYRRFSVSNFWPEMNRVGATITSTLGTMAYLLAHDIDRAEMPQVRARRRPTPRCGSSARRRCPSRSTTSSARVSASTPSAAPTASPRPASSRGSRRACATGRTRPASSTTSTSTCASSTTTTTRCPPNTEGEIVDPPEATRKSCSRATGVGPRPPSRPAATGGTTPVTSAVIDDDRYLYFVDRKADYLRRRGENISSFEVERILMGHGALADVAVHAVPSDLTEDDLKVTATLAEGSDAHRGRAVPLVHRRAARTSRCRATSSSAPNCHAARSGGY